MPALPCVRDKCPGIKHKDSAFCCAKCDRGEEGHTGECLAVTKGKKCSTPNCHYLQSYDINYCCYTCAHVSNEHGPFCQHIAVPGK